MTKAARTSPPEAGSETTRRHVLLFALGEGADRLKSGLAAQGNIVVTAMTELSRCSERLQQGGLDLLLVEEAFALHDPAGMDQLQQAAGAVPVLEINSALASPARTVRQLRRLWQQGEMGRAQAHRSAVAELHNELGAALAGLLLEAQLALRTAGPGTTPSLERIVLLAEKLSTRLRS